MLNIDPSKIQSFNSSLRGLADEMEAMASVTDLADQPKAAYDLLKKYKCV